MLLQAGSTVQQMEVAENVQKQSRKNSVPVLSVPGGYSKDPEFVGAGSRNKTLLRW